MQERGYVSVLLAAVLALAMVAAAFGAHEVGVASRRAFARDLATAGARLAADAGIERAKVFLFSDPAWSNGAQAQGPVGGDSEVEAVVVERAVQDGREVVVVTSTGRCRGVRKTVRAVFEVSFVPFLATIGGGVKQLSPVQSGGYGACRNLNLGGSVQILSDLFVRGNLYHSGAARIGSDRKPRAVYVVVAPGAGKIQSNSQNFIRGDAYCTGTISYRAATGRSVPFWDPGPDASFPHVGMIRDMVDLARDQTAGTDRRFPGGHVFMPAELGGMSGVYFVEGTAYVSGGTYGCRAAIVASGSIYVQESLDAPGLVLIAGGSVSLGSGDNKSIRVGAVLAHGDITWTGNGNRFAFAAMASATVKNGSITGNVVLEQDDAIDLFSLVGPGSERSVRTVSCSEL